MNIPNPAAVASARTARLVREAATPVYSTATRTPVREHLQMVEVDSGMGRYWSAPMPASQVNKYCDSLAPSYEVSDIDCSMKCWCVKERA